MAVTIGPIVVSSRIDSGSSIPRMRAASSAPLLSGAASLRYTTSKKTITAEAPRNVQRTPISIAKIASSMRRSTPNRPSHKLSPSSVSTARTVRPCEITDPARPGWPHPRVSVGHDQLPAHGRPAPVQPGSADREGKPRSAQPCGTPAHRHDKRILDLHTMSG